MWGGPGGLGLGAKAKEEHQAARPAGTRSCVREGSQMGTNTHTHLRPAPPHTSDLYPSYYSRTLVLACFCEYDFLLSCKTTHPKFALEHTAIARRATHPH